uniref:Hyaluronan-mediated motility receptor (RHAMM) n=1 Tax=Scophthalmus maximus TaxID=52904 RepID=A0A8D3C704_SCOMX
MSFSRAPLKRFNEHKGCAPAPGTYEIKPGEPKGAVSFDKSDRFRPLKAAPGALLPPPSPSRSLLVSPVRRTMSVDGLVEGSSVKKDKNGVAMERKLQKLLEREIRSLVQQRGEQDRRLLALEDELKKVESKLLATVREKTGLSANVTTLERQRAELKKVNEFLKNKVSADTTKKKINSLTMELMEARNTLDVKSKELNVLQINTEGQLKVLETDLQAVRATVTALKDRNKDLEDLNQVTKTLNSELENDNARLHAVIRELKQEVRVLQGYLDAANDQIQFDLYLSVHHDTHLSLLNRQLETELEQHTTDLETARDMLRHREEEAQKLQQELQASKNALWEVEKRLENQEQELKSAQKSVGDMEEQMKLANQEVDDSRATVQQQEAELARLREVLRRTEKELDERVAHLEQRYLFSEEERSMFTKILSLCQFVIGSKSIHSPVTYVSYVLLLFHVRILLEVQTSLVQKDQEMKAVEANHADRITQLQLELQLQTKEKEDALGQLGEQKGQCFTELQNEKETAQKLLQEVGSAKEDIMEQLQQERQERVKIQTALQDNRGAWEVERKDHQQVRSEVLRLQSDSETEHWRKQYEELFSKVRPFQEQLNAFAAERNVLLNENGTNQEELNKLADAYARLLGHQNQKQKIKHVMKLKDENVSLKQELSKLRSRVCRQKSDLDQLKSKLPGAPRRRFDPSKAFQHDKENRHADANEPLKEGKRYSDLMPQHPEPGNLAI